MKLGIIANPDEISFKKAKDNGLDFVEFCINGGDDGSDFLGLLPAIKTWIEKYGVAVGSIGRWKSEIIDPDGEINFEEEKLAHRLIEAADYLGCTNYVCGCNYIDHKSYYENCAVAICLFDGLLKDKPDKVQISTYNCRKLNFVNDPMAWKMIHGHLKELKIKYDPSHARYDGCDYLQEVQAWGDRIAHVHIKGSFILNGVRVDDPPAGLDQTDWPLFISLLRAKGYDRGLSIEPHSQLWQGELGERGVNYSIEYIKKLIF